MIKTGKEYLLTQFEDVKSLSIIGIAQAMEQYAIYYHESQLKNHGDIHHISDLTIDKSTGYGDDQYDVRFECPKCKIDEGVCGGSNYCPSCGGKIKWK